jgi:hypothetical protein
MVRTVRVQLATVGELHFERKEIRRESTGADLTLKLLRQLYDLLVHRRSQRVDATALLALSDVANEEAEPTRLSRGQRRRAEAGHQFAMNGLERRARRGILSNERTAHIVNGGFKYDKIVLAGDCITNDGSDLGVCAFFSFGR